MSRQHYPNQLLTLNGKRSLLQETVMRSSGPPFVAPLVICNYAHQFLVQNQIDEVGVAERQMVLEPVGRNTAAAATVAALLIGAGDPGRSFS
jgi:mannose-1-phosphate guanylyltransferase / mannose-6-phosphate isomerase